MVFQQSKLHDDQAEGPLLSPDQPHFNYSPFQLCKLVHILKYKVPRSLFKTYQSPIRPFVGSTTMSPLNLNLEATLQIPLQIVFIYSLFIITFQI